MTDADSGLPIQGVQFLASGDPPVETDQSGHYRLDHLPLGANNSPQRWFVFPRKSGYFSPNPTPEAVIVCDQLSVVDFTLVRIRTSHVTGRIVEGNPDPADFDVIIPTDTPIGGIYASIYQITPEVITASDGLYELTFPLAYNNAPFSPLVYAHGDYSATCSVDGCNDAYRHGYWERFVSLGEVGPDEELTQDVAMVKKCTVSISGHVTYSDTGLPAVNISVEGGHVIDFQRVDTDSEGNFLIPELLLGTNNRPINFFVNNVERPSGYGTGSTGVAGTQCGQALVADVAIPLESRFFGVIEGHLYDKDTGLPIRQANVSI